MTQCTLEWHWNFDIDVIYWLSCWQIWLPRVQRFAR